mgnify:CR=1 FL=1
MKASLFQKLPNVIPTKEFKQTDAWEQRKLGDALCESKVPGNKGDKAQKLSVRLWGKGVVEKKEQFLGSSTTQYYYRRAGQLIYGKLDFLHAAFGIIPEELDGFESTTDSPAFDIDDTYDTQFILLSVLRREVYEAQGKIANGSRKAKRINPDIFLQMYFFAPTLEEQKRISSLITLIDNLIAATERKKELLQKKKQAYLQLIFSQHLRFKGFTKPWRQTQISDIFHERRERNPEGELLSISVANGVQVSTLSNNSMQDLSKYKVVVKNDLAYNSMRMWQGASGASLYNGIVSPAYTVLVPQKDVNSQFYAYLFKTTKMLYIFRSFSQGMTSDTWNLKYPTLSKINVLKPSLIEQNQIAELFKTLDELIKANDKKLELLKKKKKAYLQKMFI